MAFSTKQIVERFYEAWRTGDPTKFPFAQTFTFDGPMASFSSPAEFRAMAAQFAPLVHSVQVLDALYDEKKAFVLLDFATNVPQVGSWIAIDYFEIEGEEIKYSRTVYDPRQLIAFMQSRQVVRFQPKMGILSHPGWYDRILALPSLAEKINGVRSSSGATDKAHSG
ncbi:MAG: nuclear transport factor 2 family protein [Chloroflexi bacterium]|nr:nuclear transport factor 2 family protein [Chloroflexota bacterium]